MRKKRNRRNRKAEVQVPFPNMLAKVLVMVAVFGLSYVWLCARCEQLGRDIKQLEARQIETRRRLISEQERWAVRQSPSQFRRTLAQHGLHMDLPSPQQVVRVRTRASGDEETMLVYN